MKKEIGRLQKKCFSLPHITYLNQSNEICYWLQYVSFGEIDNTRDRKSSFLSKLKYISLFFHWFSSLLLTYCKYPSFHKKIGSRVKAIWTPRSKTMIQSNHPAALMVECSQFTKSNLTSVCSSSISVTVLKTTGSVVQFR